jgi:hypothetical protein
LKRSKTIANAGKGSSDQNLTYSDQVLGAA